MQVIVKSFPVVYFYATCPKHDCKVEVQVQSAIDLRHVSVGGQATALRCLEGGAAAMADCTDSWELSISGYHDIRITE